MQISMFLLAVLASSARAQTDCDAILDPVGPAARAAFESFREHARAYAAAVQDYRGGPRDYVGMRGHYHQMRRALAIDFDAADRAKLCGPVAGVVIGEHLVEGTPETAAELIDRFCADDVRTRRRLIASAMSVIDRAGPGPYASLTSDLGETSDPRAQAAREYLRAALADESLSARDWRVILFDAPPAHLIPLLDALAGVTSPRRDPARRRLESLGLNLDERRELAGRLARLDLPFDRVVAWTGVDDRAAWDRWTEDAGPLRWLDYRRRRRALTNDDLAKFEARAAAYGRDPATPPLDRPHEVVRDLIADPAVPEILTSRLVAAIAEHWPRWYGPASDHLPEFDPRGAPLAVLHRAELFYGRDLYTARRFAEHSRRTAPRHRREVRRALARGAPVDELRAATDQPFGFEPPAPREAAGVAAVNLRALRRRLPLVTTPGEFEALAAIPVPADFVAEKDAVIAGELHHLFRVGDADLAWLERGIAPNVAGLPALDANAPLSTLGIVREFRRGFAWASGDRAPMTRAAQSILDVSEKAAAAMTSHLDPERARAAVAAHGRVDAVDGHVLRQIYRRALLTYLVGRTLAGRPLVIADARAAEFRRVAGSLGRRVTIEHVDSLHRAYLKVWAD